MLYISLLQINPKISLKDLRQELVFTPELQITARIGIYSRITDYCKIWCLLQNYRLLQDLVFTPELQITARIGVYSRITDYCKN